MPTLQRREVWITEGERVLDSYRLHSLEFSNVLRELMESIKKINWQSQDCVGYPILVGIRREGIELYYFLPDFDVKNRKNKKLWGLISDGEHVGLEPGQIYLSVFHPKGEFPGSDKNLCWFSRQTLVDLVRRYIV